MFPGDLKGRRKPRSPLFPPHAEEPGHRAITGNILLGNYSPFFTSGHAVHLGNV